MDRVALMHSLAAGFILQKKSARLMLAESCTGGMISSWLTHIAGSSHWFDGAVVSYSNAVKSEELEVKAQTLRVHGAVSTQTAVEMAEGLRRLHRRALVGTPHGQEDLVCASVTGVAGPTGGGPGKPVGTVCLAWAGPFGVQTEEHHFHGNRDQIRRQAALRCLSGLVSRLIGR